jgi:hypothetical protein
VQPELAGLIFQARRSSIDVYEPMNSFLKSFSCLTMLSILLDEDCGAVFGLHDESLETSVKCSGEILSNMLNFLTRSSGDE